MSATEEITEATVVEDEHQAHTTEIAVVPPARLAVTPQVEATELVARLAVIRDAMDNAMTRDTDYGVVPGTNSKPTLLKPGAEKLAVLFQLDIQIANEKDWGPGDHLTVTSHASVFHAPTGKRLGYGEGICSTREKKYAKRMANLTCPECGKDTIRKSKPRADGSGGDGWYCWRKLDGCGATFRGDDERLKGQTAGEVENPDLPDLWNTVVKMAAKRARVDAVLAVTGASALFTQDAEDNQHEPPPPEPSGPPLGPAADPAVVAPASGACVSIAGGDTEAGRRIWARVKKACGGYMPRAAALALIEAAEPANEPEVPEV